MICKRHQTNPSFGRDRAVSQFETAVARLTAPGQETGLCVRPRFRPADLLCIALVADTICALDILDIVCRAFSLAT